MNKNEQKSQSIFEYKVNEFVQHKKNGHFYIIKAANLCRNKTDNKLQPLYDLVALDLPEKSDQKYKRYYSHRMYAETTRIENTNTLRLLYDQNDEQN